MTLSHHDVYDITLMVLHFCLLLGFFLLISSTILSFSDAI